MRDWTRVKALFERLLDATPTRRGPLLAEVNDEELVGEVRRLLASAGAEGFFLDDPLKLAEGIKSSIQERGLYPSGTVIAGRFEILRVLGSGGMGDVYEAMDSILHDRLALKTLRTAHRIEPRYHEFLVREVQSARRVTHPNVCRVYDVGIHDGVPFLTMELLEGITLSELIADQGPIGWEEALSLLRQMSAGLTAAHAAGVVHRDFKPGNVILIGKRPCLRAVVTDFGIAQMRDTISSEPAEVTTVTLLGTPDYLAPEVLAGATATGAADVFALGCVAYEMTMGARPFSEGIRGVVERVTGRAKLADSLATDNPKWDRVIRQSLHPNPAQRPAPATEVARLLERRWNPHRLSRRALTVGATAAAVAVTVTFWPKRIAAFGPAAPGVLLVVAEVQNTTNDTKLSTVGPLLREEIKQSGHINLLDAATIRQVRERMGKPGQPGVEPSEAREIAARGGAALVLFSAISPLGQGYTLNLQIELLDHGPVPVRSAEHSYRAGTRMELLDAIQKGAEWIREIAGESPAQIARTSRPPQDLTTDSWDALDEYSRSAVLSAQNRHEDAVLLLLSAVRRDPDFASGWARLGDLSNTLRREADAIQYWKRAVEAMGKRKLARKEELRILGMFAFDTGAIVEADQHFRTWSIEFPADPLGRFYRTIPLAYSGRGEEALENLAVVEPALGAGSSISNNRALVNLVLNRPDHVLSALDSAPAEWDRRGIRASLRAGALLQKLDLPTARSVLQSARSEASLPAHYYEGLLLAEAGKFDAASAAFHAALAQPARTDEEPVRADLQLVAAAVDLRLGRLLAARQAAQQFLTNEPGALRSAHAALTLIAAGDLVTPGKVIARLSRHSDIHCYRFAIHKISGALAMVEGDAQRAIRHFESASALQPSLWYREYLAQALSVAGRIGEALQVWEAIVQRPAFVWTMQYPVWPGVGYDALVSCRRLCSLLRRPEPEAVGKRLNSFAAWIV